MRNNKRGGRACHPEPQRGIFDAHTLNKLHGLRVKDPSLDARDDSFCAVPSDVRTSMKIMTGHGRKVSERPEVFGADRALPGSFVLKNPLDDQTC